MEWFYLIEKSTSVTLILCCILFSVVEKRTLFFNNFYLFMVVYLQFTPLTFTMSQVYDMHCASERWLSWHFSIMEKTNNSLEELRTWLHQLLVLWPYKIPVNLLIIKFVNCKNGHTIYLMSLLWQLSRIIYMKCLAYNICTLEHIIYVSFKVTYFLSFAFSKFTLVIATEIFKNR